MPHMHPDAAFSLAIAVGLVFAGCLLKAACEAFDSNRSIRRKRCP